MILPFEEISIEVCGAWHGLFAGHFEFDADGRVNVIFLDQAQTWGPSNTLTPLKQTRLEVPRFVNRMSFDDQFTSRLAKAIESECGAYIDEALAMANAEADREAHEAERISQRPQMGSWHS